MPLPNIVNGSWLMACLPARQVHRIRKETTNYELRTTNHKSKGFTLIELLVVISIIAILMAVATVSYLNAQQKGRDNKRKTDLKAVQQALEIYFNQNAKYPAGAVDGRIMCNTGTNPPTQGDNDTFSWGSAFLCDPDGNSGSQGDITYMNPLPKDPVFTSATQRYYYENPTSGSYILSARLENTNDRDFKGHMVTNIICQPHNYTNSTTYETNYCVTNP